jgi:hypothetical protein
MGEDVDPRLLASRLARAWIDPARVVDPWL